MSGDGDDTNTGLRKKDPFATLTKVEAVSEPGDRIVVLASDVALDGGIVLKPDQDLIGRGDRPDHDSAIDPASGAFAVIANSTGVERDGHAITCLAACTVTKIWLHDVHASGIAALGGSGDVAVGKVRISNFNTGNSVVEIPEAFDVVGAPGIRYDREAGGDVIVRNTVIGPGLGSGLVATARGDAAVDVHVARSTMRDLGGDPGVFGRVERGVMGFALADSDVTITVRNSTFSNMWVGVGAVPTDSGRIHTAAIRNNVQSAQLGISMASPVAPTAISARITRNTMSDVVVGVNHNSQSAGTADVQRVVIADNDFTASNSGVTYEHGTFTPGIPLPDHRAEVDIRRNHVTISGDPTAGFGIAFPILVATNLGGNEELTAVIERNTIVGGPDLSTINPGTIGIMIASFAEAEFPPMVHTTIRRNQIRLGPATSGIGFAAVTGLRALPQGAYSPPYFPGWEVTMKVERNCVEETGAGFAVVDGLGWGYSDLTVDLGGGDLASSGRNQFIGTDADILFQSTFVPGFGPPFSVPDSQVIARNNYWGGGAADVVDQNGLLGTPGFADLPDTSGFLTVGPSGCGSF